MSRGTQTKALLDFLGSRETRPHGKLDLIGRLPLPDQVFIVYLVDGGLNQTELANLLEIRQPSVFYNLGRILPRLKYLLEWGKYSKTDFEKQMSTLFSEEDTKILVSFFETTCQSKVACCLGLTQGKVRHRILRALEILEEQGSPYGRMLRSLHLNLNTLGINRGSLREKPEAFWTELLKDSEAKIRRILSLRGKGTTVNFS